jgi:hypothetical protein
VDGGHGFTNFTSHSDVYPNFSKRDILKLKVKVAMGLKQKNKK